MSDIKNLAEEFGIQIPKDIDKNETILLVESQQDIRLIVAHHLNKIGYRKVVQAANGMEALEALKKGDGKTSVIISAMEMPTMGGIHLLQELQENPQYQRGPFAISIESPSKEKIMYATENGVDGILVKPFTFKDILPKLQQAFKVYHNPENPEKVYEMAKQRLREGNLGESEIIYQKLATVTKTAARPHVGLARVAFLKGNHEKALEYLSEAEKRNQHFVPLYVLRGEILASQKKLEPAIEQFKKAIEMSPLNPVRYEAVAQLLFELNEYQKAVDILTIAVRNNLSFPSLHHYLSQAFFALKDFKSATRHVRSALSQEPENVTYLNQLGICYKESGFVEDAMKTYNSIIKLDPDNKAALYNKAVLLNSMNQKAEAVKLLQRVVQKYPEFIAAKNKISEYEKELVDDKNKAAPKAG